MGSCKSGWRAAALTAAVAVATLAVAAAAAQRDVPAKERSGTLTIEVWVVDPETKNERQPVEGATVSIVGIEDRRRTNDQGRTTPWEIATGKIALNVKMIGADLCKLQEVSVVGGDQVVRVLVEKSPEGKCRRLE